MKKSSLTLIFLILFTLSNSMMSQIYSFEDGSVPTSFTTTYGALQNASNKYKLGTKSLRWDWSAYAKMTVVNPTGLSTSSTASGGGITCWIYNTAASSQKLTFAFLTSGGVQKCKIDFNLNFVGWRCLWAQFSADMGHDKTSCNTMTIAAPTLGSGTFYIDYLEFPAVSDWTRMSDLQVKVAQGVNPPDGMDDYVALRNMNITPLATVPTNAETAGADSVLKRVENWYLGTNAFVNNTQFKSRKGAMNSWINRAKTAYTALNLQPQSDGTILGEGLFNEAYQNNTIDGLSIAHFRDFGQGSLIPLAFDFRMNGTVSSKTAIQNVFDWWNNQGWADGSAMGSLRFEKIRFGGYIHSLFLMRNDLGTPERLTREMNTLKWLCTYGYTLGSFANTGDNADVIRTVTQARLAYTLMQTDLKTRVAGLYNMRNYFENAFSAAKGYSDTFKSDFTGYHHSGVYLGSYYPHALYVACLTYYLFHDTPYALSDAVFNQLKNNLLAYRKIASVYDVPTAACGRFPEAVTILEELYPCYAYLALSKSTPDAELLAAFERLYQPTVEPVLSQIGRTTADITFKATLGEIELCLKADALGAKAESGPQSQDYYPYAGLHISRDSLRHVSIKGFSKYIWDFESTLTENPYGRYLSYGQIEYTSLTDGRKNNAYSNSLFNWSRIPGTTVKSLSSGALVTTSTTSDRNFSDESFLGGAVLNDSTSMFSMKLHDNTFDKSFYANKSVFCFGNVLVCTGSNITNNASTVPTFTTLLQHEVLAGESIKMNGAVTTTTQTGIVQPVIADNLGNRFIVKDGSVNLNINSNLYSAVINHGNAPKNQTYCYYMLLKSNDAQETKYKNAATNPINIVRQDNLMHIVQQKEQNIWAYSIFDATATLTDAWISSVNSPSMLMIKQLDSSRIDLVVSDPDMRRGSWPTTDGMSDAIFYDTGTTFNYQVVLKGLYSVDGTNADFSVINNANSTTVKVNVKEGRSYSVRLKNLASGADTILGDEELKLIPTEEKNSYRVISKVNTNYQLRVLSMDGRLVKSISGVQCGAIFSLGDLSNGVYLINFRGLSSQVTRKLIKK